MINERVAPQLREPLAAGVSPQGEGGVSTPSAFKVIGVTGGMASGKSTVARLIARDRYTHLDADALVHHLMATDPETIETIGAAFPGALINGMISRAELSKYVAQDAANIVALESILHPRVRQAEERAIDEARIAGAHAVVLDIPLLFESGAEKLCDVVVAVSAPLEVRKARAFARPAMNAVKWDRLIARQLTDEEREAKADHVIHTDCPEDQTRAEVEALLKQWELA